VSPPPENVGFDDLELDVEGGVVEEGFEDLELEPLLEGCLVSPPLVGDGL
jgi:hypothetical protein